MGGKTTGPEACVFNAGGSTYLLDTVAVKRLAPIIDGCFHGKQAHQDDLFIGCCLQKQLDIVGFDTRDEKQGETFHIFPPSICVDYRLPPDIAQGVREDYYFSYSYDPPKFMPLPNFDDKGDFLHCSPKSVAFHHLPTGTYKPCYDMWYTCSQYHYLYEKRHPKLLPAGDPKLPEQGTIPSVGVNVHVFFEGQEQHGGGYEEGTVLADEASQGISVKYVVSGETVVHPHTMFRDGERWWYLS
jgi:hypothetical protein